jgi:hypothetical protein
MPRYARFPATPDGQGDLGQSSLPLSRCRGALTCIPRLYGPQGPPTTLPHGGPRVVFQAAVEAESSDHRIQVSLAAATLVLRQVGRPCESRISSTRCGRHTEGAADEW